MYSIPIVRARYEGQNLIDRIEALDRNRRIAHERAIMGVQRLNRYSRMFGLPTFFDGDENDRYAMADFYGIVAKTMFEGRMGAGEDYLDAFSLNMEGVTR